MHTHINRVRSALKFISTELISLQWHYKLIYDIYNKIGRDTLHAVIQMEHNKYPSIYIYACIPIHMIVPYEVNE